MQARGQYSLFYNRATFVGCVAMLLTLHFMLFVQQARGQTQAGLQPPNGMLTIPPFEKKPERFPKGSLKSKRMIFSEDEVRIARANIMRFPEAGRVSDSIVKGVEKWMSWDDKVLYDLLSDARVPRAFDINSGGCPVHGDAIFKKGGFYPWIIDPKHPFKVKCPIGQEVYPSNDFEAHYKRDFTGPIDKSVPFADDGWGWLAPNGQRYWFVAYANHWIWMDHIQNGIRDLGRSYLLTGDKRYAHKALVMLYRLAEVYPSMNHEDQSRYGLMSKAEGRIYPGKVLNYIWECWMAQYAAEAYDMVWDAIDGDAVLQDLTGKSGEGIRSFIEANLLEEAIDAYLSRKIEGNFGMHQTALLNVLLARQHTESDQYIRKLVDEPGEDVAHTGIRFALYNQVFRDGLPLESPSYNMLWLRQLAEISEILKKSGTDFFQDPRFKMLFDAPLEIVATGRYTPDWGDSGSTLGGVAGRLTDAYQVAYASVKDPDYLTWMAGINKTGSKSFSTFGSLFREALPETSTLPDGRSVTEKPSRLFAGYGTGILNNKRDKTAVAFTYGMHVSHFHYDFLNFEVFANRQKMMPDLGYPDATDEYASARYSWSNNTPAHNTVVVDERKQQQNLPGVLHDFAEGSFARSMDAASPAYKDASQYRRNLIMVDVDQDQSYLVDFFNVTGGTRHDYFLHGPPGSVSELTGTWGSIQPGTLAGTEVKLGAMYDDEKLGAKGYSGGYGSYVGSGYQHFFNVQKLEKGNSLTEFKHINDPEAKLRIHMDNQPGQTIVRADAYDKPRAKSHVLKYLIARREATAGTVLKSTFVSVIEPFSGKSYIKSTRRLLLQTGSGQAVEITREKAVDVVMNDTLNTVKKLAAYGVETDANSVVLTFDAQKKLLRIFFSNGTYLKWRDKTFINPDIKGTITDIDVLNSEIEVLLDKSHPSDHFKKPAPVAHFTNQYRTTVHPLAQTSYNGGKALRLKTKDALLTGRIVIESVDGHIGKTFTDMPLEKTYAGTTLLDHEYNVLTLIEKVESKKVYLSPARKVNFDLPRDCWLSNIGVGDKMTLKNSFSLELSPGN